MSDSRRPDERWSPFEQDLLSAGKDDAPARGARRKTLMALGVGTGGGLGSSATASGSAAGHAATPATVAGAVSKLAPIAVAKWIALGLLGVGAVATAVHTGGQPRLVNPPAPVKQHVEVVSPAPPVETHPVAASIPHERGVSREPTLATHAGQSTASEAPAAAVAATGLQRPAPVSRETRTELASPRAVEDPAPVPSSEPAAVQNETAAPPATAEATTASSAESSGPLPPMAALSADASGRRDVLAGSRPRFACAAETPAWPCASSTATRADSRTACSSRSPSCFASRRSLRGAIAREALRSAGDSSRPSPGARLPRASGACWGHDADGRLRSRPAPRAVDFVIDSAARDD